MLRLSLLIVTTLACGAVKENLPDANDDAPKASAITLTITRYDGPVTGTPVIFHNESGEIVVEVSTDGDGRVNVETDNPLSATIIKRNDTDDSVEALYSYVAVEPNTSLKINLPDNRLLGSGAVFFPSGDGGGNRVWASGPCITGAPAMIQPPSVTRDIYAHCLDAAGKLNFLGLAYDDNDIAAASWVTGRDASMHQVQLPAWDTDLGTLVLSIDKLRTDAALTLQPALISNGSSTLVAGGSGVMSYSLGVPKAYGEQIQGSFSLILLSGVNEFKETAQVVRKTLDFPATISVKDKDFLPTPELSFDQGQVTWTGPDVDGYLVVAGPSDSSLPTWRFLTSNPGQLMFPTLPSEWQDSLGVWKSIDVVAIERSDVESQAEFYQSNRFDKGFGIGTKDAIHRYSLTRVTKDIADQ